MLVKQYYNQCKVSPLHHNEQQELHCSPLELVQCLTFSLLYPLNFIMGSLGKFIQISKTKYKRQHGTQKHPLQTIKIYVRKTTLL